MFWLQWMSVSLWGFPLPPPVWHLIGRPDKIPFTIDQAIRIYDHLGMVKLIIHKVEWGISIDRRGVRPTGWMADKSKERTTNHGQRINALMTNIWFRPVRNGEGSTVIDGNLPLHPTPHLFVETPQSSAFANTIVLQQIRLYSGSCLTGLKW